MAFYNSGIRNMFKDSRVSRTKNKLNLQTQINTLKSNETSDDSNRSSIASSVAANTSGITTNATGISNLNNTNILTDKIHSQEYTATFNDFFFAASMSIFQFPIEVPGNQMIQIVQFETIIYNPEAGGKAPTYNVASNSHVIQLTRNSADITANSTAFTNSQSGGPLARVCSMNAGPTAGPIYQTGTHGNNEDHRRTVDHLNHRESDLSDNVDTHLKICVAKDATATQNSTSAGAATKIKILVRYRLMNYPTLA